ncbi:Protein CHROMOSOME TRANSMISSION FIDELITY 7 [Zea mays]|uniref:Protein CHROMOSOME TRANSMISSION FIDELITY 7 n=1 Tax=Zea mays TaxID=4577 RepID=A0A1D6E736_MAIZE|nr:Protein CHROMOSOME TRANSMISSION FIDELITY 7 [Zea mays]
MVQKKTNCLKTNGRCKENLLRRQDFGDFTVCFLSPDLLWQGASMPLLQDQCILSLQRRTGVTLVL